MTKKKYEITLKIPLTKKTVWNYKPFSANSMVVLGLIWIILCYLLIFSDSLYQVMHMLFASYSTYNLNVAVRIILVPGAIALSYGNALLSKVSKVIFWIKFILGSIIILALANWMIYPLALLLHV